MKTEHAKKSRTLNDVAWNKPPRGMNLHEARARVSASKKWMTNIEKKKRVLKALIASLQITARQLEDLLELEEN